MAEPMDLFQGLLLGLGLQQLPRVLQALQKTQGGGIGSMTGGAPGQGAGMPGLEGVDPAALMPLLMPLLQAQAQQQAPPQGGPVPGVPRPPSFGGTAPGALPPAMPPVPPPTMGRMPVVPRVLPMSAGVVY